MNTIPCSSELEGGREEKWTNMEFCEIVVSAWEAKNQDGYIFHALKLSHLFTFSSLFSD